AIIRLLLETVNLLILDEPTNHLDMKTKDILKQAIKDFDGTVIVVSHDREFLDGLVEKVYEFGGGQVKECLGGIYDFLEKKKLASLQELELSRNTAPRNEKTAPAQSAAPTKEPARQPEAPRRNSYAEQREHEKLVKRARKKVEEAEAEIARIEQLIKETEDEIAAGRSDSEIFERHSSLNKQLENAMSMWELASMNLEKFS
ncbi:MAG: ABC transporter ATP-binding protein, partial [Muribaculaceae bacterium]|nr:ABC transporter ATP-binding protein [Muribaculaceae bacterium]